jgi:hypothetical protein
VGGELLFQTQPGDNSERCVNINNSNPRLMSGARIGQESSISAILNANLPTKRQDSIRYGSSWTAVEGIVTKNECKWL